MSITRLNLTENVECDAPTSHEQWRRLHRARAPPPFLEMAGHGDTVSRRTANTKLTKLY